MCRAEERPGGSQPLSGSNQALSVVWLLTSMLLFIPLFGCGEPDQSSSATEQIEPGPEQQFYDYRLIESEDGIKRWVLESERMDKFADRQDVELYGVRMLFYREGEYFSTLTSARGKANLSTKNLFAWGEVVVVTSDDRRLETEELHYDDVRGLIHNDVFDRFTQDGDVMTGIGLEATPDLEYIEIKQQVRAEVSDESSSAGEAP